MGSVPSVVANAKKALDSANDFTKSATAQAGNKANPFAPKPAKPLAESPSTNYSHVRTARKEGEFMGVRSNEAPDINSRLEMNETAKKALEQQ